MGYLASAYASGRAPSPGVWGFAPSRAASPGVRNYAPPQVGASYGASYGDRYQAGNAFGSRLDNGSSNAYANGCNQNVGNVLSDRRTTKVLEPPGGRSQVCFG